MYNSLDSDLSDEGEINEDDVDEDQVSNLQNDSSVSVTDNEDTAAEPTIPDDAVTTHSKSKL
jgi:hypothetical protein